MFNSLFLGWSIFSRYYEGWYLLHICYKETKLRCIRYKDDLLIIHSLIDACGHNNQLFYIIYIIYII